MRVAPRWPQAGLLLSTLANRAQDLLANGATLATILRAGQWRSAAFLHYLNEAELEKVCWTAFWGCPGRASDRSVEPCQGVALEVAYDTDDEEWVD